MKNRQITLNPDWRSYFWYYLAGVVLIPLFGAGLLILWILHRRRTGIDYEIHDTLIREIDRDESREVDLVHIHEVTVRQSWIEKKFGTGTVRLQAAVSSLELRGMDQPHKLAKMIRRAAEVEIMRLQRRSKRERADPEHDPGTLDKIDYLTGLWQQGLISNEDYEKEKKYFKA